MAYRYNPFTGNFDYYEVGGSGASPTVVANYSALPDPTTVAGQFYFAEEPQGTWWLWGNIGGTYYPAGDYYSNGVTWKYEKSAYQATQAEVNAGVADDKFVTPLTLTNATIITNKSNTRIIIITSGNIIMGAVSSTDYVYLVAGAHTMTLPTAVSNTNRYTVKNNHNVNVTVNTTSSQTIDGTTTISIAPEDSVDLISNGTNWNII